MGEVIQFPVKRDNPGCKVVLIEKRDGRNVHLPGSNFWTTEDGLNVEVEFQAVKFYRAGKPVWAKIVRSVGYRDGKAFPFDAKKKGRSLRLTQEQIREWDSVKLDEMRRLVEMKARRSPRFREWLVDTDSNIIVEDNWWHDQFWGNCTCGRKSCMTPGSNWLGHILMTQRRVTTASGIYDGPSAGSQQA